MAIFDELPAMTSGYNGRPSMPKPTQAPPRELVKARLKRAVTNICSEWTIPGNYGQPKCGGGQTCLFTSFGSHYYEGCGSAGIHYDWITECWNYPKSGSAPASQRYCSAEAPYCGYLAFVFTEGATFSNFGCSVNPYSLTVNLVDSALSSVILAGASTKTTIPPLSVSPSLNLPTLPAPSTTTTRTPLPLPPAPVEEKTPIAPIVGGAVGGFAVLAFIIILLLFLLRKRRQKRQKKEELEQQQAHAATAAAFHNSQRGVIAEVEGKPLAIPAPIPFSSAQTNEKARSPARGFFRQPRTSTYSNDDPRAGSVVSQSPPPVYTRPVSTSNYSQSNYSELDPTSRAPSTATFSPISPVSSPPPPSVPEIGEGSVYHQHEAAPSTTNLAVANRQSDYSIPQNRSELGGESRPLYKAYKPPEPNLAEGQGGEGERGYVSYGKPLSEEEVTASTGGIVGRVMSPGVDMSGGLLGEEFRDDGR